MQMDYLTLDVKGVILAFLLAFVMFFLGLNSGYGLLQLGEFQGIFYVTIMLYFLIISAVVTGIGENYKKSLGQYQKARGVKNVLANGLGPLIFVLVAFLVVNWSPSAALYAYVAAFLGSVAAVTADKFSSELGILGGTPVSILTLKKVRKGASGGVTLLGLGAGLLGAFLIAIVGVPLYLFGNPIICQSQFCSLGNGITLQSTLLEAMLIAVTLAGLVGTVVDSIVGHYEEKGIGNKYTSNFICSIAGGLIGLILYFVMLYIVA